MFFLRTAEGELKMKKTLYRLALLGLLLVAVVACGGGTDDDTEPGATQAPTDDVMQGTLAPDQSAEDVPLVMTARQARIGGTGTVADFEWSLNGQWLAAAGGAGVLIYDMTDFSLPPRVLEMQGGAQLVTFSPDSTRVAAANGPVVTGEAVTQFVYVFNVQSGELIARAPTGTERVSDLSFGPDNLFIIGGLFQEVRMWNASNMEVADSLPAGRKPTATTLSSNNALVAFYDGTGNVEIVNRISGDILTIPLPSAQGQGPSILHFINGNQQLLVAGEYNDLTIFDVFTGDVVYTDNQRPVDGYVNSVNQLVASASNRAYVFDLQTLEDVASFDLSRGYPSPDGSRVAVRELENISIYDARPVRIGSLRFTIVDRTPFYSAGRNLVAGYRRGGDRLYVIDPTTLNLLRVVVHQGRIAGDSAAISPDGSMYAVLPTGGPLRVWDTQPWELLAEFPYEGRAIAMAISPDNRQIVVASGGGEPSLRVLDAATGREVTRRQLTLDPNTITFAPADNLIVVVGDRAVVLVDAETGQTRYELDLNGHILPGGGYFLPDASQFLLFGGDGGAAESWINFYDTRDYELIASINGLHRFAVTGIAASTDGEFMYTVGRDTFLNQWDLPSRTLVAESNIFLDEMGGIVALNDAATELLTVTERGVMQSWVMGPERLVLENASIQ